MLTVVARWLGVLAWLFIVLGIAACDPGEGGGHGSEHEGSTGTTTGSSCTSGPSDTGAEAVCGNDLVEAGEHCDGTDLAGATCASLGHGAGTLACTASCTFDKSGCTELPAAPVLMLGFSPIKQFDFSWAPVDGADYYQLEESTAPGEPFVPLGGAVIGTSVSHTMPLHFRYQASYRLRACNVAGCTDSAVVDVVGSLAEAVGYFKASNTDADDLFGWNMALSPDGRTLAIGAVNEDGSTIGIDGDQTDDAASRAGAAYVFVRDDMGGWSQQAYLKASNTDADDLFGCVMAFSADGNVLAIGAQWEDSSATGIDGDQANDAAPDAGAVYVFVRDGTGTWSQQAYIKASNTDAFDRFGVSTALSADGNTLAVGAVFEGSNATGIDGDQANDSAPESGAAYVFVRDGVGTWSQQAYLKASNTDAFDRFGISTVLSADGNTLVASAIFEGSGATGIDGDQANDAAPESGAVYVFVRDGMGTWSQQAYLKASNTGAFDGLGNAIALSADGNTLAVGALWEDSDATGIDGNQANDAAPDSGAVYVFARDGVGTWSQQVYLKASNTRAGDEFGHGVALSADGDVLGVGAINEGSDATGIEGDQANEAAPASGAAYVFVRDDMMGGWSQQTYLKASNTGSGDNFGWRVMLSGDGDTLVVSADAEASDATGIGGDQANDAAPAAGAVYLY